MRAGLEGGSWRLIGGRAAGAGPAGKLLLAKHTPLPLPFPHRPTPAKGHPNLSQINVAGAQCPYPEQESPRGFQVAAGFTAAFPSDRKGGHPMLSKSFTNALAAAVAVSAISATAVVVPAGEAAAEEAASTWMLRGRVIGVIPDEDSSITPNIGKVDADSAVVPELDITYFFTPNIAAELIAATSNHDMEVDLAGGGTLDLGDVWVLPPTLLVQYHFMPEGEIRPYAGIGINYTHLYGADDTATTSVDYDGGWGWALQAGVDVPIGGQWFWNLDVKKIWVNVDATVNGTTKADVDLDPWVIGTGLGYRF